MNILLYALAAIAAGVLAIRAPLGDRVDPARRAFAVLASTLCLCYVAFTLYLFPGLGWFKYVYNVVAGFLPAALLGFVDSVFRRPGAPRHARLRELTVIAGPVALAFVAMEVVFFRDLPRASPAEVLFAVYVIAGLSFSLLHLWRLHQASANPGERARLRYFGVLLAFAVGFSAFEALVRSFVAETESALSWVTRPAVVQGALPPAGAVFTVVFLYFTYQVVVASRLLDLAQMFSKLGAVAAAASILVVIDALSVASLIGDYPVHGATQVFMASALFLLAYEPLSKQLESWIGRLINPRGERLRVTLQEIDDALTRALSIDQLAEELQVRLIGSERATRTGLWLWDEERRAYRLVAERGEREEPALVQVSRQPFTDGFGAGARAYVRTDLERQRRSRADERGEAIAARLGMMEAMHADLVLPFTSGDVVLGWLTLRDDGSSEALTEEELGRLLQMAARASVALENVRSFEKLKEEHRLAALGTMAAGLAHEIRNPLAGIKGAAQYLQGGVRGADAEMVRVIIDEVDRLSEVVSQFLDYARPLQVHREPTTVHALVGHVAGVLRASGLPDGVQLVETLPDDLPALEVDPAKLTQVLLNLCRNAVEAMKEGGTLTLRAQVGFLRDPKARRAPAVEIAVEDTGHGIAPDDLDKLFVPFFTTRHDGTGLGLAISRRLVHAHGGELDVRSAWGSGSTFTVRIPVGATAARAA